MNSTPKKMTRQQEHDFYAKSENQEPQGPARRRRPRLTEIVPVRFPEDTLEVLRARAEADDRSVSSWIRRAVEHELDHVYREDGDTMDPAVVEAQRRAALGRES